MAALRSLKARQAQERLRAGRAYRAACADCGGEHLVVNETGEPYLPELVQRHVQQPVQSGRASGLPAPRRTRHTSVTLMILNGVPIPVVSAWHGHATPAFTMAFYAHSQDDALARAGERLADVYGSAQGRL